MVSVERTKNIQVWCSPTVAHRQSMQSIYSEINNIIIAKSAWKLQSLSHDAGAKYVDIKMNRQRAHITVENAHRIQKRLLFIFYNLRFFFFRFVPNHWFAMFFADVPQFHRVLFCVAPRSLKNDSSQISIALSCETFKFGIIWKDFVKNHNYDCPILDVHVRSSEFFWRTRLIFFYAYTTGTTTKLIEKNKNAKLTFQLCSVRSKNLASNTFNAIIIRLFLPE